MKELKVHLAPCGVYSPAMVRIADALTQHAPSNVTVVQHPEQADLRVLYVIDSLHPSQLHLRDDQRYVVIQCCLKTTRWGTTQRLFAPLWRRAALVWSYYDLTTYADEFGFRFYHSPLGVADIFRQSPSPASDFDRLPLIVTCGRMSAPDAEAIEEAWRAARATGYQVFHIGPTGRIDGLPDANAAHFSHVTRRELDDEELAALYRRARYVVALRHSEGFEMPAAEGLCCGARAIVFDQPCMRRWYSTLAEYVIPAFGAPLITDLARTLAAYSPRTDADVQHIQQRARANFDWSQIAWQVWANIESSLQDGQGPPAPDPLSTNLHRSNRMREPRLIQTTTITPSTNFDI